MRMNENIMRGIEQNNENSQWNKTKWKKRVITMGESVNILKRERGSNIHKVVELIFKTILQKKITRNERRHEKAYEGSIKLTHWVLRCTVIYN